MRHPFTRAERRLARANARERYRDRLRTYALYAGTGRPEDNRKWNQGGKQCEAHGNRCAHSLIVRHERRQEIKRLRSMGESLRGHKQSPEVSISTRSGSSKYAV